MFHLPAALLSSASVTFGNTVWYSSHMTMLRGAGLFASAFMAIWRRALEAALWPRLRSGTRGPPRARPPVAMTKAQRRKEGNQVIATKPNDLFNYWRADEAAECLELPDETYSFLWIEIVPRQGKKEFHEDRVHEEKNLARYWKLVPEEHRVILNKAAEQFGA